MVTFAFVVLQGNGDVDAVCRRVPGTDLTIMPLPHETGGSRIGRAVARRVAAIVKGRGIRELFTDVARLERERGLRGLAHRFSYEVTRALAPPEPPPPPPPPVFRNHSHVFYVAESDFYNPSGDELKANRDLVERFGDRTPDVRTATWFVPWFEHVLFGGIHTILRFVSWMQTEHGVQSRIVIYDNPHLSDNDVRAPIASAFPELADIDIVVPPQGRAPYVDFDELPATDIAICTIWYSAYALMRFNRTGAKYYFVQDFEPAFYPAGTLWAMAEATYRFGFAGLVNTPGLGEVYSAYGNPTCSFTPAVDWRDVETDAPDHRDSPVQIVIYGRPSTDRNGFELLTAACRRVKARFGPKVRIVSAGEDFDPAEYELDGIIENVGLLRTRDEIRDLYRHSDIGMYCMFSRHPSYQPFEYLASGMAVVTNVNPYTSWLLRDGENCLLAEPFSEAFAEALERLVDDPELRRKLVAAGAHLVNSFEWEPAFDGLWRFITNRDPSD
jgi:glycosyltransferase involved in cell wall biosynthesis